MYLQVRLEAVEKLVLKACFKLWKESYEELFARAEITFLRTQCTFKKCMPVLELLYKLLYMLEDEFTLCSSCRSHC